MSGAIANEVRGWRGGLYRLLNAEKGTKCRYSKGFGVCSGVARLSAPVPTRKSTLDTGTKISTMLNRKEIEDLIYSTVDIVPHGEDSVFLGLFRLVDNPETLDLLLVRVTAYYDRLIEILPLSVSDRLSLQMQRCFRYEEYRGLFKPVQDKDFRKPIFRTLLLTSKAELSLFTNNPTRDESYKSFVALLDSWSKVHNPFLHSLIYDIHN